MNRLALHSNTSRATVPVKRSVIEYKTSRIRRVTIEHALIGIKTKDVLTCWHSIVTSSERYEPDCECLAVILLDSRYRIKAYHIVSIGTLTTLLSHPREVFRLAITSRAFALVLIHNHPSDDPTPSQDDIEATKSITRAGEIIGIQVVDHLIIGASEHYSFRAQGLL
jgi:DNA repair protein RadC